MNEQDMYFLLDQLSNSMEFYDELEFISHMSKETDISKAKLKIIWDEYWKLEPMVRAHFGFEPEVNEEWINSII